jgi:hypothetical protein
MDYEIMHAAIKILDKRSKQMDGELYHKYGVGPAYSSNKQVHGIGPAIDAKLAREIAQYAMDCIDQEVKKLSRDNGVANIIRERSSGKIKYNHGDWRDDEQAFASDRMIHSIVEKIKNSVENKVQSRYGTTTTDLYRYGFGNNKRFDNDNVLRDISSIIHEKINEHVGIAHSDIIHTAIGIMDKREAMDELYHYGRKGMKWDEHIFAEDEESRRRRAGAQNEETGAQRAARLKKELLLRRANKAAEKEGKGPYQDPYSKPVTNTVNSDYYKKKYGGIGKGSDYVNTQITNKQKAQENAAKYGSIGKGSDYANKKIAEQAETNKKAKQDELISRGKSMLPDYKKIAENREAREKEDSNNKIKDAKDKVLKFNDKLIDNPVTRVTNPVLYNEYKNMKQGNGMINKATDTYKELKSESEEYEPAKNVSTKNKENVANDAATEAIRNMANKVQENGFNEKDFDTWINGNGNGLYETDPYHFDMMTGTKTGGDRPRFSIAKEGFRNAINNEKLDIGQPSKIKMPGVDKIKNSDKYYNIPEEYKDTAMNSFTGSEISDLANEMSKYGFEKDMFPITYKQDHASVNPLGAFFDKNGKVITNKKLNDFFDLCGKLENGDYEEKLKKMIDNKISDKLKSSDSFKSIYNY